MSVFDESPPDCGLPKIPETAVLNEDKSFALFMRRAASESAEKIFANIESVSMYDSTWSFDSSRNTMQRLFGSSLSLIFTGFSQRPAAITYFCLSPSTRMCGMQIPLSRYVEIAFSRSTSPCMTAFLSAEPRAESGTAARSSVKTPLKSTLFTSIILDFLRNLASCMR